MSNKVDVAYLKGEETREVVGYEGLYGVSNKGNVYSLRSGCLIEGQKGAYVGSANITAIPLSKTKTY